jgi:hypothetical protein
MAERLPDISAWYDRGDNALGAAVDWLVHARDGWKRQLAFLGPRLRAHGLTSVVEFGPGSGLLGRGLCADGPYEYLGVEKSGRLLERACQGALRRAGPVFVAGDVRDYDPGRPFDCACGFRLMKHIALDEWDAVLGKLLTCGRFGAFDAQVLAEDLDDGADFPHVYVTEGRAWGAVRAAGHEVLGKEVWHEAELPGRGALRDVAFWTRRRD